MRRNKQCRKCECDDWLPYAKSPQGTTYYKCAECNRRNVRAWKRNNPDKYRAQYRQYNARKSIMRETD